MIKFHFQFLLTLRILYKLKYHQFHDRTLIIQSKSKIYMDQSVVLEGF